MIRYLFRVIISLTVLFFVHMVYATSGCCSRHGGEDHCDPSTNQIVCQDGSYSPTCTCDSNSAGNDSEQSNSDDNSDSNTDDSDHN